jgi:hypothetical protein
MRLWKQITEVNKGPGTWIGWKSHWKVLPDHGGCAAETCSSNEQQMYIVSDTLNTYLNTFTELNTFFCLFKKRLTLLHYRENTIKMSYTCSCLFRGRCFATGLHDTVCICTYISIQNYWGFGLFPSSGVLGCRNTTFRKLNLNPSSGEGGEKTHTQLGPLEIANLNHLGTETIQFPKRRVSTP